MKGGHCNLRLQWPTPGPCAWSCASSAVTALASLLTSPNVRGQIRIPGIAHIT
jgi:hypothetical protein